MAHDATLPTVRGVLMPSFYGYSQYKIRQRQGWTEKYERDNSEISRGANRVAAPRQPPLLSRLSKEKIVSLYTNKLLTSTPATTSAIQARLFEFRATHRVQALEEDTPASARSKKI